MFRNAVKALIPKKVFRKVEPYGHLGEAVLANFRYGFPARGLKVIGVTGTDGKTTTTLMIWTMLKESGYKVGYMSTVGYGTQEKQFSNYVHMTSLQAFPLMRRIRELRQTGIEWLVLETTSHALAQNRVWGIPYSVAVMTNLNHEHLDYHGTFGNYRAAKQRLFHYAGGNRGGLQVGVVNSDDPSAALFAGEVPHPYRYGIEHGDIQATDIDSSGSGSHYRVIHEGRKLNLNVQIPGRFNIYNSLAAVCVGLAVGLSDGQIEKGIASVKSVEGRMNTVDEGQDFDVIVDFAHTPEAFQKLLSDIRPRVKSPQKLIVVFGTPGQRDPTKGAKQGEAAGRYADIVIVTEEDDRDADGQALMEQCASGAEKVGKIRGQNLFLVHDRPQAICEAIGQASSGDTVLLLGKGHEKTIERADGEHPWDEAEEARRAIQAAIEKSA